MTHTRFGRSNVHPIGQLTHTRRSDGAPEPDGALKAVARANVIHYRQLYLNRPDPIVFMSVTVDTSGRIYDDFSRLLFFHAHREPSDLINELPGVDFGENFGHEDFYTSRFVISVFYTTTTFYLFQTIYTTFRSFPCFSSSVFCLRDT